MTRKSTRFLALVLTESAIIVLLFLVAGMMREETQPDLRERAALVRQLALTDLCLFTEARYTRNPTQADRHAAFQDGPFSLEHFPSGSILPIPKGLKAYHASLD